VIAARFRSCGKVSWRSAEGPWRFGYLKKKRKKKTSRVKHKPVRNGGSGRHRSGRPKKKDNTEKEKA